MKIEADNSSYVGIRMLTATANGEIRVAMMLGERGRKS